MVRHHIMPEVIAKTITSMSDIWRRMGKGAAKGRGGRWVCTMYEVRAKTMTSMPDSWRRATGFHLS